jgi:DNA-directed RNA polymerase subunit RPC12/RpoP
VSINNLDSINLYINVNGTGWKSTPLITYEEFEEDWFIEEINLTEYKGNYVKFRFNASLDEEPDFIYYKGVMVDYFAIKNASNISPPEINFNMSMDIKFNQDLKYQKVQFSLEYFDQDNNYPEYVYLEIDNVNYSMINYFGDWNASSNIPEDKGIYFVRSLSLGGMSNRSFKFYISDGKFANKTPQYNVDNELITYNTPKLLEYNLYQEEVPIGFQFSNSLENFYVTGKPIETERTAWLQGDNTWHIIHKLYREYFYGGMGQGFSESFRGYGMNWDAQLITKPIKVLSKDKLYLEFKYEIDLQNEGSIPEDERDYCQVLISSDFGETWKSLKKYYYNSEGLPKGNESVDISNFIGETVMIKFTLHSNDYAGGSPGYGWLLSDIYIGYDRNKDHASQNIYTIFTYLLSLYEEADNETTQIFNPLLIFYIFFGIITLIGSTFIIYKSVIYLIEIRNKSATKEKIKEDSILRTLITKKKSLDVNAAIEHLEKTQAEKPLISQCKYCKSWFYSYEGFDIICPNCKRDQVYAAYNCINCGKWYFKNKPGEDYYCEKCNIKLLKQDKEDMEELINKKGKILKKYTKETDKFSILD